jgi:hypothetical protein
MKADLHLSTVDTVETGVHVLARNLSFNNLNTESVDVLGSRCTVLGLASGRLEPSLSLGLVDGIGDSHTP